MQHISLAVDKNKDTYFHTKRPQQHNNIYTTYKNFNKTKDSLLKSRHPLPVSQRSSSILDVLCFDVPWSHRLQPVRLHATAQISAGEEGSGGEQALTYNCSSFSSTSAPLGSSRTRSRARNVAAPRRTPGSGGRAALHDVRRCRHRTAAICKGGG
eukprot:6172407-Pleurochrysis_carterae.AAC.1